MLKKIESFADNLHKKTVSRLSLRVFTAVLRPLLAIGFIPPSIPKIMHVPFTRIPESHPVGDYFAALYRTGWYYDFIGWSQLFAALLLLIPRTSHLGALLFLPIIANIMLLTNSVGFKGTWLVTIMMFLACLYLVCWDYPRWKSILFWRTEGAKSPSLLTYGAILLFFAVVPAVGFVTMGMLVGAITQITVARMLILAGMGAGFGLLVILHLRFMRIAPLG